MSRGARVRTALARRVWEVPAYVGRDGRERVARACPSCDGFGRWNWRQQRRVGLSAKRGDPHVRCEHCKGSGVVQAVLGSEGTAASPKPTEPGNG